LTPNIPTRERSGLGDERLAEALQRHAGERLDTGART
jgi:hypothetical protein